VPQGLLIGTGRESGADEDDFHTLKRVRGELDREDKKGASQKRATDLKVGTFSGVVKAFAPKPIVKKVVRF
jgi:zinc finger CCHC domain-containing protein 9